MPKHSKRFTALQGQVDKDKVYTTEEAVNLVKTTSTTKFDSSVEVHVRVGIDPKKGDQQVRGTIVLPHGNGKTTRVAVFVEADRMKEAQDAGADLVGEEDLIAEIKKTGKCDFDVAIATPETMKKLSSLAKILGPKGLMPSPKNETITMNIKKAVEELKKGKISFRNDDTANVHQSIGKVSFSNEQLTANFKAFMEAIEKAKPESSKGVYIKNVVLTSTMGPGLKVDYKK